MERIILITPQNSDLLPFQENDILIPEDGFSILESKLYRSGNFVSGYVVIKKNNGYFTSNQERVCAISGNYNSSLSNYGCFVSSNQWLSKDVGYAYVTDSILIAYSGTGEMNIAKVLLQLFRK